MKIVEKGIDYKDKRPFKIYIRIAIPQFIWDKIEKPPHIGDRITKRDPINNLSKEE